MKLYEIADQVKILESLIDSDFTEDDETALASVKEALDGAKMAFADKLEAVAKVRSGLLFEAESIIVEMDRLVRRRKSVEKKANWLKGYVEACMLDAGQPKVKTPLYSFNIQKNPPSVEVLGAVPEEFMVHPAPTVDKRSILERLKAGEELSYARLIQGESLRIR